VQRWDGNAWLLQHQVFAIRSDVDGALQRERSIGLQHAQDALVITFVLSTADVHAS